MKIVLEMMNSSTPEAAVIIFNGQIILTSDIINEQDRQGKTLLMHAIERNQDTMVSAILEHTQILDLTLQDNQGHSTLYYVLHRHLKDSFTTFDTNDQRTGDLLRSCLSQFDFQGKVMQMKAVLESIESSSSVERRHSPASDASSEWEHVQVPAPGSSDDQVPTPVSSDALGTAYSNPIEQCTQIIDRLSTQHASEDDDLDDLYDWHSFKQSDTEVPTDLDVLSIILKQDNQSHLPPALIQALISLPDDDYNKIIHQLDPNSEDRAIMVLHSSSNTCTLRSLMGAGGGAVAEAGGGAAASGSDFPPETLTMHQASRFLEVATIFDSLSSPEGQPLVGDSLTRTRSGPG